MMDMLGIKHEDLPLLMAVEHWSQAKYVQRGAQPSDIEGFLLLYRVSRRGRLARWWWSGGGEGVIIAAEIGACNAGLRMLSVSCCPSGCPAPVPAIYAAALLSTNPAGRRD